MKNILFTIVLLSLGFTTVSHAQIQRGADVVACASYVEEGSRDYRAQRAALQSCQAAGHGNCQLVESFCFDREHCFAQVESCQGFVGFGSRDYRALRNALTQCKARYPGNCWIR